MYDPNLRPRLVSVADAAGHLEQLGPHAELVTPSLAEGRALLGVDDPAKIAETCRSLGARAVAVTCGADGVWLDDGGTAVQVPAVPAPVIVDQTGAGDAFAGTVAARLAIGDPIRDAVRRGMAAASASLAVQGGCG